MIDLHSHLIPAVDDGSSDLEMSVEMARLAVADGVDVMACTPHITPGVYDNRATEIVSQTAALQQEFDHRKIPLRLVTGADVHATPDIVTGLTDGRIPTLGNTRYFLFEPPHHVLPPGLEELASTLLKRGLVPVLTHPERLSWIEKRYDMICALDELGCAVQLTAASVTGRFGSRPLYWSERLLDEGRVDILASDAHNASRRPPGLKEAADCVARRLSEEAAIDMVESNPSLMLADRPLPEKVRREVQVEPPKESKSGMGRIKRWLGR